MIEKIITWTKVHIKTKKKWTFSGGNKITTNMRTVAGGI